MASLIIDDSDEDDLLRPSIASKTWITTPDMIDNVLSVCPNASREDIKCDLLKTHCVTTTINKILDGEIASNSTMSVAGNPSLSKREMVILKDEISPVEDKKGVETLSDTDIDTDTDDSDIVIVKKERQKIFTSLKERLGRTRNCNTHHKEFSYKETEESSSSNAKLFPRTKETRKNQLAFSMEDREYKSKIKTTELRGTEEIEDISFNDKLCEKMNVDQDDDNVMLSDDNKSSRPSNNLFKKWQNNKQDVSEIQDLSFEENIYKECTWSLPSCKIPEALSDEHHSEELQIFSEYNSKQVSDDFYLRKESDSSSDTCEARATDVSVSDSEADDLPSSISAVKHISGLKNEICLQKECLANENIPKKKKKGNADEARKQREEKKILKEKEKQKKKEMAEREKSEKQKALLLKMRQKKVDALNQKQQKKEDFIKAIEVCMDPEVLSQGTAVASNDVHIDPIIAKLTSLGVTYSLVPHAIPSCITWKRVIVQHEVGEDLEIKSHKTYLDESTVIVRLDVESCISLVDQFKKDLSVPSTDHAPCIGSFCTNLANSYKNKAITLVIVGLEMYFRHMQTKRAREFRNAVRSDNDVTKKAKSRSRNASKNRPEVSKIEVEEMCVYIELTTDIKISFFETEQDLAEFVGMFTKAIAESPFKKTQPETFSFCVDPGKTPPVKITKDGIGLPKLWLQQLQQYHNLSANMAAAIVSVYPSPQSLIQAYRQCADEKSASILLKDIVVRRGEGALATSRRIGPELSRQIYTLFNATDGQTLTK